MHPMFTAVLFTVARTWKQPKCPSVDEWIKTTMRNLHNEILSGHKKEEKFALFDSMDGPGKHYTK